MSDWPGEAVCLSFHGLRYGINPHIAPVLVARPFGSASWLVFATEERRRHSRHYVEHSDGAKASQGVLLDRRSSGLVQYAG